MALKLKVLFSGDLTSGTSPGWDTPLNNGATKAWLIKNIYFYNGGASAIVLDVYFNKTGVGSNAYLYKGHSVAVGGTVEIAHEITLDPVASGDKITAKCVNNSGVKLGCIVYGIERDQ